MVKNIYGWILIISIISLFFICDLQSKNKYMINENNTIGLCNFGKTWFDGSPSLFEGLENKTSCDAQTSVNSTVYANSGLLKNLQEQVDKMNIELNSTTSLAKQNQESVKKMVNNITSKLNDKQKQLQQLGQEQQEGGLTSS